MALGKLSRESVLSAIQECDDRGPGPFRKLYGFDSSRKFVLSYDGRRYDSKAIAGVAYGYDHPDEGPLRPDQFSGGDETIKALEAAGFGVEPVAITTNSPLRDEFQRILDEYADARQSAFGSSHSVWQAFERLANRLNGSVPVASRSTLSATWSAGRGNWARVPWVALLDSRETTTTQSGVYPVYLFRQDLSGVYLTLAQGVTEPKKLGRTEAVSYLQGVAQRVRQQSSDLAAAGFKLDSNIDLQADPGLGRDYEISTIAYKLYEKGDVPSDDELLADLHAVVDAYEQYIDTKQQPATSLEDFVSRFRRERPYPTTRDEEQIAAREELRKALSKETLQTIEDDPSLYSLLDMGRFAGRSYGNPGSQSRVHQGVIEGGDDAKRRVARAFRHGLYGDGEEAQRIDDVLQDGQWNAYGLGEHLLVKALSVVYPERWLPIFGYGGEKGKKRLSQAPALAVEPLDVQAFDSRGEQAVESNRRLRQVLEPLFPEDPWGQGQFLYWLSEQEQIEGPQPVGLRSLAEELLLDEAWLAETVDLLRHKRQLIFYGPPGTGKTYVARKLAEYIAQDASRFSIVQFHPSYAYEDFVEGYRPTSASGGSIEFELKPGPLRRMAETAAESEADWCLLIDEINRGNIAKVFGELYYLLEYRDDEIELQYGGRFSLPRNLYVIGTMNTADRSIALLDAALRRRFHFVPFFPDQPPINGLLRRWLEKHKPNMAFVAELVDRANAQLPDRHLQVGPSHFMTSQLDADWLVKIWRGSVLPYIEEQFFDEPDRVRAFTLESLRAANQSTSGDLEQEAGGNDASSDPTA